MTIRFKCDKCGTGIKAPDKAAGKTAKCPKCKEALVVPNLEENVLRVGENPFPEDSSGSNQINPNEQKDKPNRSSPQQKPCPFCGETILAVAIKCKYCGEFLDGKPTQGRIPKKGTINTAKLREEYKNLIEDRNKYQVLSFAFGLPGILLIVFQFILMNKQLPQLACFAYLGSVVLLFFGLGYSAKYKGRNFFWGIFGFLTIIGLIFLLVLHDFKKDRLIEIKAQLNAFGEPIE